MRCSDIFFLLVTLTFFSTSLNAQRWHFGLQAGLNLATQVTDDPSRPQDGRFQWNTLPGWNAGLTGIYYPKAGNRLQLQGRLLYNQKGFREPAQFGFGLGLENLTLDNRFEYLSADALLRLRLGKGGEKAVQPLLFGGAGMGYLFRVDMESRREPFPPSHLSEYSGFNRWPVGLLLGLGLQSGRMAVGFETRHDVSYLVNSPAFRARNWVWALHLGMALVEVE